MKHSRILSVALVAACLLATFLAPASGAATVTAKWKASFGSNGSATLSLLSTGAGTFAVSLKGLPAATLVIASVNSGTCSAPSTITSIAARSSSSGKLVKTRSVTAGGMADILGASSLVVRVRAGSWSKCARMKGGPAQAAGSFGAGTKLVGTDVKPGTYRTRTPVDRCYWQRLSGLGGTLDEIIANDNATGYAVVTISPADVAFDSSRCGTWSSNLSAVTESRTTFGEGTFIVGTDMQPGRYRSSDASGRCYWQRMSAFGGTLDEIIANDNVDGTAIVDIAASDLGFSSSRCGDWTLVQ